MANKIWSINESKELAGLIYAGHNLKAAAAIMGWSHPTAHRYSKIREVKQELSRLRDPGVPDQYYQGATADSESDCPYAWYETYNLCWWKAGFHDAARGYV